MAANTQIYDIRRIVSKNTMAENQWVDVIHSVLLLVQSDLPIYSFFFPKLVYRTNDINLIASYLCAASLFPETFYFMELCVIKNVA